MNEVEAFKNMSMTGWRPCTEECYPDDDDNNNLIVIAWYREYDNVWDYWTYDTCPYGWNVLCRNNAYWKMIEKPIKIK